jgi:hypothetical protein
MADYGLANIVAVRYHGDSPWEFDPFYNANAGEVDERLGYYGVSTIPITLVNGLALPRTCLITYVREAIESELEVSSPIRLVASESRAGDSCFVDVNLIGEAEAGVDSLVLRAAVIEDSIDYAAPNGMTLFNAVFRRFLPDPAGLAFAVSPGETLDFHFAFEIDPQWDAGGISTVVFVQNDASKAIVQAASTKPRPEVWAHYRASERGRVVLPGHDVSYPGTFTNQGTQVDTFDVDLSTDLPSGWAGQYALSGGTQTGNAIVLESDSSATLTASLLCGMEAGTGRCTVTLTSRCDPGFSRSLTFFAVSGVCALVVDDDGGLGLEGYYGETLDSLGVVWGHWDRSIALPTVSDLHLAEFVVWFTGDYFPTLEVSDQNLIASYLDTGGDLFITGQDIGYALNYVNNEEYSPEAVAFYETYLKARWSTSSSLIWDVSGEAGDPIGDGLAFSIEGGDGADNQDYPDVIDAIAPAQVILDYTGDPSKHCGVRFDSGSSKVVYLSFGFEGISTQADRELLLSRIIAWFGKTAGLDERVLPMAVSVYPNPAVTRLNIAFGEASGATKVEIYDVLGRAVKTLGPVTDGDITWSLTDEAGRRVSPGVYLLAVSAGSQSFTRKVVLAP